MPGNPFLKIGAKNNIGKLNQPYILDTVDLEWVFLQSIPTELVIKADTQFVDIETAGRNVPRYHYTGGEDSIEFTINWWAEDDDREDVLNSVKWIENLGRINSSKDNVHPVKFIFGKMFMDSTWIVQSAGYRLGLFQRPHFMYPAIAEQTITLKRISDANPGWRNYLNLKY